jgi:hypothetical protein
MTLSRPIIPVSRGAVLAVDLADPDVRVMVVVFVVTVARETVSTISSEAAGTGVEVVFAAAVSALDWGAGWQADATTARMIAPKQRDMIIIPHPESARQSTAELCEGMEGAAPIVRVSRTIRSPTAP